jgi:hypothetical protein
MKDSYKNPFSGVNAVQLEIDSIVEYWCNPFRYDLFSDLSEADIYEEEINIVFMGGRSTGKSMLLRYWSYQAQHEIAKKSDKRLVDLISENKGIGFYFRIDGPVLRSFQGHGFDDEYWSSIFIHYFELIIGREYIEAIRLLQDEKSIEAEVVEGKLIPQLCDYLDFDQKQSLDEIVREFDKRINEVDLYRGNVAFFKEPFEPKERGFSSQSLSFGIPAIIADCISLFKKLNVIILLDEYENFLQYQQIVINTLLRFTKPKIKFRIGMRLEGFKSFMMISKEDFIKEGREYRKVVLEEVLDKNKEYRGFLIEVARKRLDSIPALKEKQFTDIRAILSESEDHEQEAKELVRSAPNKIYELFSKKLAKEDLNKVRYRENPLLELLNYIWLTRGVSPERTVQSMRDYLENRKTPDGRKYRRDYVDKYKLSLLFLLCRIYKRKKLYYSFNTFAFLSSGIVGNFIELCRWSFAVGGWNDNDKLRIDGFISKESQSKAARIFSEEEKKQISRIEDYGGLISQFVDNIGNIFHEYHVDFQMRYPETNQFAINVEVVRDRALRDAIKSAIKWSVIQRKPRMQRSAPSENLKDLYIINRIFSPSFQISYRTRGGKSVLLNERSLRELMSGENFKTSKFLANANIFDEENDQELTPSLFSMYE